MAKYIYTKSVYTNIVTKICITCPQHGDFWQTPASHMGAMDALHVGIQKGQPLSIYLVGRTLSPSAQ